MNWFLIVLLVLVCLLAVYEAFQLVRAIIKHYKKKKSSDDATKVDERRRG